MLRGRTSANGTKRTSQCAQQTKNGPPPHHWARHLEIEYRFADDNETHLPELVSDLVRHQVRVIATVGSALTARAAKDATNAIPIVFGFGADPVKLGLVTSLNRPGGNVTGVISLSNELFGKQLGMLHVSGATG